MEVTCYCKVFDISEMIQLLASANHLLELSEELLDFAASLSSLFLCPSHPFVVVMGYALYEHCHSQMRGFAPRKYHNTTCLR